ncbi:inner membrane protein YpjD [Enterovibrio sp. ZSDZ35]|uniref:Inner membrane protein YpjD n=1 Tax=Enterovibrio qingdaonensis TaxID=2899818 RepID=A0ABT5QQL4_9GAMM|nr:inner membrane protein YpjD [Enterovibrio sp. ZSDZ35]MDD1782988.1 inner membrane protein YpjD [Enterovibrio sp. ZSDZ35]
MDIFLAILAAVLYFSALLQIIPGLSGPAQIPAKNVFFTACGALGLHAYLLADLILADGGQNLSILNVASLISFIISAITTGLMIRMRVWILLPVVYSFAAINLTAATLLPGAFITHLEANPHVLLHISLALFSYSTLMIATLYAIQLAWLDHQLKAKKKLVMNPNLPPLMAVERQLFNIILIGEVLLTLTLLSGIAFVHDMIAQGKAHKAVLSAMAWAVYGVLLWGHYRSGWRGKRVIWISIVGAFLLTLAYFGSRFVKEVIISA